MTKYMPGLYHINSIIDHDLVPGVEMGSANIDKLAKMILQ